MTKKNPPKWFNIFLGFLVPLVIVIIWFIATNTMDIPSSIFPKLGMVKDALIDMIQDGQLQEDLAISFQRIFKGYFWAIILGVTLGVLMGMSPLIRKLFYPTTTSIRQIPMMAWVPMVILWCGIGELSKVVIIVIAAFFPIMVNTLHGIEKTPENYLELSRLYKLNKWETFRNVYLPHALPSILVGLKLGLSSAWMAVVGAEMIAASSGIGFRMQDSRSKMRADSLMACMLVVGIVGILMDKGLEWIFHKFTPWEKKENQD